jgi:two-component system cell cycle sensor histidine kinase/response regulator CckA
MSSPLRVLILDDSPADACLMLHELRQAGFVCQWERVESEPDFLARLAPAPDVILSDYRMPQFDATRALQLLRERGLDVPFLIVSGSIGEDLAVAAMREGATDYLLKDRMGRLGQAVKQALEQQQLRARHCQAERDLRESQERTGIILGTRRPWRSSAGAAKRPWAGAWPKRSSLPDTARTTRAACNTSSPPAKGRS